MMESDVKSARATASGVLFAGRARLRGFSLALGASGVGNVQFRDGGATGPILCEIDLPANAAPNPAYVLVPGHGVVFQTSLYATLTNMTSVTAFYA